MTIYVNYLFFMTKGLCKPLSKLQRLKINNLILCHLCLHTDIIHFLEHVQFSVLFAFLM